MPCSELLSELEWTVLASKLSRNGNQSAAPPSIAEALISIAKLGGYLARKKDGPPGTLVLWRGLKRLMDLAEGCSMALKYDICG
jgi:hypothetical protein